MFILIIGLVFAIALLFLPRILARSQSAMLAQYEILERRFQFKRTVYTSKWGGGIGERHSLSGSFSGYPVSLYDHYREGESGKVVWTTLAMEMLYAGEREIVLEAVDGDELARFERKAEMAAVDSALEGFALYADVEDLGERLIDESLQERINRFRGTGSFRLSKGFFEYRETGRILDEAARIRFQEALTVLAELGDRVAELVGRER